MIALPVALRSFLEPGRILHLFGPAASEVARHLLAEAVSGGWVEVPWPGRGSTYPRTRAGEHSVVVVSVHGSESDFWDSVLPTLKAQLQAVREDVLVGVSVTDVVPKRWKFCAAVRLECLAGDRVRVVKTLLDTRQGCTYVRVSDGVWGP